MLFKDITVLDQNFEVREHTFVGVKGDVIDYIGDTLPKEDYGEVYEGKNHLLLPAFYNLHSHLPMVLMRGYGEGLPLMDWLNTRIFPFEANLTDDDIYYGALMGAAESLRFGIGGISEMYLSEKPLCKALFESGVKANVSTCYSAFNPDVSFFDSKIYKDTVECIEEYNDRENGRIKAEFSLHSEYTNTERSACELAEAAKFHNSSMHVHVSESAGEVAACKERHEGRSPVKFLNDCGLFDVPTVAAHCVHTDAEDLEILKAKKVSVSPCPKSNAKLGSGISPAKLYIDSGVNIGIGTDSVASNNNLSIIEEMRFCALAQNILTNSTTSITPKLAVFAATRGGAVAQNRNDSGRIKVGSKADLTVLNTDKVYMKPVHDILTNLLYSAQGDDVVLTMVDGKVLYKNGVYTTIDIEKVTYETEKRKSRILGSMK